MKTHILQRRATHVAVSTSLARATSRATRKAALLLFSVAVLLAGGAAVVRGQSALDGFAPNAKGLLQVPTPTVPTSNAAGDLDLSFGNGGKVKTDFPGFSQINAVLIQSDGKIVAAGVTELDPFVVLARYNLDGSLDQSFGAGGKVVAVFALFAHAGIIGEVGLAIQADGKIIAAGSASDSNPGFILIRYNTDGSLDSSFGTGGQVTTGFGGSFDKAHAIVIQPDGKIIAAGGKDEETIPGGDFALARYNTDGSLDSSFGTNGKVTTDFSGNDDTVHTIALQTDGKIVAAGSAVASSGFSGRDFALARYNPNGTLDSSFGTGGKVTTDFGSGDEQINGIRIQTDGKIVAAGSYRFNVGLARLARYNTNGSLDANFGTGGKVTTDFSGNGRGAADGLVIQTDGKIVVAGATLPSSYDSDFAVARYNINGSLDPSFGSGGIVRTDFFGSLDEAHAIALQADGRVVAAGFAGRSRSTLGPALSFSRKIAAVSRYNTDGSLDLAFGMGGKVTTQFFLASDSATAIAIQTDGKIVVVGENLPGSKNGSFTGGLSGIDDFKLARYNSDGSLDASFGNGGKVTTDFGTGDNAYAVALQPDGKIVVGGLTTQPPKIIFALARYNSDGSLDTTFGTGGKVTTDLGFAKIFALGIQGNGKILAAGLAFNPSTNISDFAVVRYNSNGSLDDGTVNDSTPGDSFGTGGKATGGFAGTSEAHGVAIQPDGKIVTAGFTFNSNTNANAFALARFNINGTLDSGFGTGGRVTDIPGRGLAMALQSDGRIVVAGSGGNAGALDFAVARYNANGAIDASFGSGGVVLTDFATANDEAAAVAIQADGKIVAAGYKDFLNRNSIRSALARYQTNGSLDPTFGSGGKITTEFGSNFEGAQAIAIQSDGRLVVAGFADTPSTDFALARYVAPSTLLNISTRMRVLADDKVLIGGFIITGTDPKRVIIRGISPSLNGVGVTLSDPTLELHRPDGSVMTNDNWKVNDQTGQSQEADIRATTIPPGNDLEAALVATLSPGNYSVVLAGKNRGTGVGLVEVYDLAQAANSKLANISSRGFVDINDNVMIGGFIVGGGGGSAKVIVRAIGPSLSVNGAPVPGRLADPTLELHNASGTMIVTNDNWKINDQTGQSQEADVRATTVPPANDLESAIVATLPPDNYTAIVRGKTNTTGVGLVEVYNLQ